MSLSMLSMVSTGNSLTGTSQLFGVGSSGRYNHFNSSEMINFGLYNNLSSGIVYASGSVDATLILFKPFMNLVDLGSFNGDFMQISVRKNSGSPVQVNQFSDHGFNNAPRSAMVVAANRGTEFRLSFRDLFLDQWRTMLDAQLAGSQARRHGDPSLTWEMWPTGISHLSSSSMYLKVHQRLDIVIDWWPDYEASLTYHIYLHLDGEGHLRGHTARWAYWVEGGIKSGGIADALEPAVIAGMGSLDDALDTQLEALSGVSFSGLYYLPGRQLTPAATGVMTGNTLQDVTIVVQL